MAFSKLGEEARRHLPVLGLFRGYVSTAKLAEFTKLYGPYKEFMGSLPDENGFEAILVDAGCAGFLETEGGEAHKIAPGAQEFLLDELQKILSEKDIKEFTWALAGFYSTVAAKLYERILAGEAEVSEILGHEEGNLISALETGMEREEWGWLQALSMTINASLLSTARGEEWAALRGSLLELTGEDVDPKEDLARACLWLFLRFNESMDLREARELEKAEEGFEKVLTLLDASEEMESDSHVAETYHQLGLVHQYGAKTKEAVECFEKALELKEKLKDDFGTAMELHHLGIASHMEGDMDRALERFKAAKEISGRIGNEHAEANDLHHMGMVLHEKGDLDDAIASFTEAMEISERIGNIVGTASDCHHIGTIYQEKNELDTAVEWFNKAIEICESTGREREKAMAYHHLGLIAQSNMLFGEAEEWYVKALATFESLKERRAIVSTLAQLGSMNASLKENLKAINFFGRALSVAGRSKLPQTVDVLKGIAVIMDDMGEDNFVGAWRSIFNGNEPPTPVLRQILEEHAAGDSSDE